MKSIIAVIWAHHMHTLDLDEMISTTILRTSCLKLEIKEFRCYEAKIEESKKGWQPSGVEPGHLWLEPPVFCH